MSAIVGIYFPGGRSVDRADVERMVVILAHRGPDDTGVWSKGSIGLGHRMLWTTPESLQEKLPLVSQTGDLVLTADARIDNRNELISLLGLTDHPSGEIADSHLILAAYKKWGEDCAEKLLGDFAFAIWDARKQKLFCARDPMGVKPFYYYHSDNAFVFASEIKALFCLPQVPRQLNEVKVADYLIKSFQDKVITFYKGVLRLPPAHSLIAEDRGMKISSYWSPDISDELKLRSDEEYAAAFREIFNTSVRCRLRCAFPVGSYLSGGLDSSSIACASREILAQSGKQRLNTYSAIFPSLAKKDPRIDERRYMSAVVSMGDSEPHYIYSDRLNPLDDLLFQGDEVIPAPNAYLDIAVSSTAHQHDNRIILSGYDGDSVVSYGYEYLLDLFCKLKWITMVTEANALRRKFNPSFPKWKGTRLIIWKYGIRPLIPEQARYVWRMLHGTTEPEWSANTLINPDFAQSIGLSERVKTLLNNGYSLKYNIRKAHYHGITGGLLSNGLEFFDRIASTFQLEILFPFFDRRVIEFCLTLPPRQNLLQGWPRNIMRRAMSGILPQEVQWRFDKSNLSASFHLNLLKFNQNVLRDLILSDSSIIAKYADIPALRLAYNRYVSDPLNNEQDCINIFVLVTFAHWLRHSGLAS